MTSFAFLSVMLPIIGVRVHLILLSFSSDNKRLIASYFYVGEDTR